MMLLAGDTTSASFLGLANAVRRSTAPASTKADERGPAPGRRSRGLRKTVIDDAEAFRGNDTDALTDKDHHIYLNSNNDDDHDYYTHVQS